MSAKIQINMNDIMADAEQSQAAKNSSVDANIYMKLEMGLNTYRLLPVPANDEIKRTLPYYSMVKHFGFIGKNGKDTAITCTMSKYGSCPICDEWGRLSSFRDQNSKERANAIKPQQRYVYTVLNTNGAIGLLDLDVKAHDAILATISTYCKQIPGFNPYELETGYNFDIKKSKEPAKANQRFAKNIFTVAVHLKQSSIPQHIIDQYENLYIFPEKIYVTFTPQEVTMAMNGDWSFYDKYMSKNSNADFDPTKLEARAHVSTATQIKSVNQSGGITAQSVNKAPLQTMHVTHKSSIDAEIDDLLG